MCVYTTRCTLNNKDDMHGVNVLDQLCKVCLWLNMLQQMVAKV
jgi:hypothetical protein